MPHFGAYLTFVIYDRKTFIVQATGWKGLPGRNAIACLASLSVTSKNGLIKMSPGGSRLEESAEGVSSSLILRLLGPPCYPVRKIGWLVYLYFYRFYSCASEQSIVIHIVTVLLEKVVVVARN